MAADANPEPQQPAAPLSWWDPVNRPPVDAASLVRIRRTKGWVVMLALSAIYVHFAGRTPAGQPWIFGPGLLANLALDVWALVYVLRRPKSAPVPQLVPRKELVWNLSQGAVMMLLFGELLRTDAGRQVIFALFLVWVPVGMLFGIYTMVRGIVTLARNRKSS